MYYIIASHGTYAQACKSSCEMITGAAPSFVDFQAVAAANTGSSQEGLLDGEYED